MFSTTLPQPMEGNPRGDMRDRAPRMVIGVIGALVLEATCSRHDKPRARVSTAVSPSRGIHTSTHVERPLLEVAQYASYLTRALREEQH